MLGIIRNCAAVLRTGIYNLHSGNLIRSTQVSLKALNGRGIEIMSGSFIDKHSRIGGHVYIGSNCFVTKARIGSYSSIANNVSIGPGEHSLSAISTSSAFMHSPYDELTQKECIISADVWIGVDTIVRRGVTIGVGAVIGANSFVNTDVPAFAVYAGSPAKLIKFRFGPATRELILKSNWWEKDLPCATQRLRELERELSMLDAAQPLPSRE